jgi:hypothetical protein
MKYFVIDEMDDIPLRHEYPTESHARAACDVMWQAYVDQWEEIESPECASGEWRDYCTAHCYVSEE